jgi:hypothetical protein
MHRGLVQGPHPWAVTQDALFQARQRGVTGPQLWPLSPKTPRRRTKPEKGKAVAVRLTWGHLLGMPPDHPHQGGLGPNAGLTSSPASGIAPRTPRR